MPRFFVVVDDQKDWAPYYPSQDVISFDQYLRDTSTVRGERVRVINLCRKYRYLGTGYYCALLAEARGHHAFPSVRTLNDLSSHSLFSLDLDGLDSVLEKLHPPEGDTRLVFRCWFGQCLRQELAPVAKLVFEHFPCPILEVTLQYRDRWFVQQLRPVSLKALQTSEEQDGFASTFERFSRKMWRKPKARKRYRYDLAILVNPEEKLPPSDTRALRHFIKAANSLGIDAELIRKKDYLRLPEYDGLFIRETTAVSDHTYRFAKKAEAEGLVVIDDPTSILRCTNKVYLAELLGRNNIDTPRTFIVRKEDESQLKHIVELLGFPLVLKVPDGSFSRGVVKVANWEELKRQSSELFRTSALLLVQEFMYTEFDWRVGVLNGKAIFACRYYMVRNHWQIYRHGQSKVQSGGWDTMATYDAPPKVIEAAVNASRLIGDGFYGVDIKQSGDRVVVIEVNDNPSIESSVEDGFLGNQLYTIIMEEFLRRMEARHR